MIYRLPARGTIRYRGSYPNAVRHVSASGQVVHVELNNGERLIMRARMLVDLPRYGKDFRRYLRDHATVAVNITKMMYGHLLTQRDIKAGQLTLLQRWDSVFAAEIV